ncbi:MAG TPA: archaetidylserine decarboxylase [Rariglobus sp.]|jgi:phosphatidylserine decarboxylase|nr:archaetidylserine decarboxylase [Rariglobus sp.]
MSAAPIRFFNRYTGSVETERIYGEKWLRWTYETGLGRFAAWALLKRAVFSHWYGWRMDRRASASKVKPFIRDYALDPAEFSRAPADFKTFNEFFYRTLKAEARPIAPGDDVAVFAADGRHLAFPDVDAAEGFYVKGAKFSLRELFGDELLAREFAGGAMVISRLCPVDYHRFHFPVAGVAGAPRLINGYLYSVSPVALRRDVRYLVQNKRVLTLIDETRFGRVAMFDVGATCVGTIKNTFVENQPVVKGAEKGFFTFGGSCVIMVFQKGRIRLADDVVAQSAQHIETYVKMGDILGAAF